MGRPRIVPSTTLNLRVDQEFKVRLAAAAYHDMVRTGGITTPDQVNLSDWLRNEVLDPFLKSFEHRSGGREALAAEYARAQAENLRALLNSVEKSLPDNESDKTRNATTSPS